MKHRYAIAALIALALPLAACDEAAPAAPTQVVVTQTQNVILGTPVPNATPSPGPGGAADKVIVGSKVTEIGGDGQKQFSVGERFALTLTPVNAEGKDPCVGFPSLAACGAYTEQDVQWALGAEVSQDCNSASAIVCDLGPGETNYNRNFRALRAGSFTVFGRVKDTAQSSFTGSVR